jgi:hypothetical protein
MYDLILGLLLVHTFATKFSIWEYRENSDQERVVCTRYMGKNCIMKSFIICTLNMHVFLLIQSSTRSQLKDQAVLICCQVRAIGHDSGAVVDECGAKATWRVAGKPHREWDVNVLQPLRPSRISHETIPGSAVKSQDNLYFSPDVFRALGWRRMWGEVNVPHMRKYV